MNMFIKFSNYKKNTILKILKIIMIYRHMLMSSNKISNYFIIIITFLGLVFYQKVVMDCLNLWLRYGDKMAAITFVEMWQR